MAMPSPEKRLETPPQSELGSSASNVPPSLAKRPRDAVDAREAEEPALNGLLALSTACAREDSENESPHTSNDAFKSARKKRRVVKAGRSSPVSPDPDSPVQPVQGKATGSLFVPRTPGVTAIRSASSAPPFSLSHP